MSKSDVVRRQPTLREGEGSPINVEVRYDVSTAGQTIAEVGINVTKAPVPERKYSADTVFAMPDHGGAKLLFGQTRTDCNDLRTLIVISISAAGIDHILTGFDSMKSPSLTEIKEALNIVPEKIAATVESEPPQTVEMSANLAIGAISSYESCLDFYHASAFSLAAVQHTKQLAIEPVVRVFLRTSLLYGLLDRLRETFSPNGHARK